jgi:hypothetical protein
VAIVAACSPSLNWREVRLPESELVAMFPCKPEQMVRSVTLGGAKAAMRLASCTAEEMTFGIGYATLAQPAQVDSALAQLRAAASDNIGASATAGAAAWRVTGMTPHPLAQRWEVAGHGADGSAVRERVGLFTRGLAVYQATVVGASLQTEAVDTFFGGLKLSP